MFAAVQLALRTCITLTTWMKTFTLWPWRGASSPGTRLQHGETTPSHTHTHTHTHVYIFCGSPELSGHEMYFALEIFYKTLENETVVTLKKKILSHGDIQPPATDYYKQCVNLWFVPAERPSLDIQARLPMLILLLQLSAALHTPQGESSQSPYEVSISKVCFQSSLAIIS